MTTEFTEASAIKTAAFDRALKGDGIAALSVAQQTETRKRKGERDTEFVKRIGTLYVREVHAQTMMSAMRAAGLFEGVVTHDR